MTKTTKRPRPELSKTSL